MKTSFNLSTKAAGFFRTRIKAYDGRATPWSKWEKNLLLDCGLDRLGNSYWANVVDHMAVGTGANPTSKDTVAAGVTLTQAGNLVTVDGGADFFLSTDTGALLKFGAGAGGVELYITNFNSTSSVTVSDIGVQAGSRGVVYYVNATALQTHYADSTSQFEAVTRVNSAAGIPTATWTYGFQFDPVAGAVTFKELSVVTSNGDLWSRFVLPGGGDTLSIGQIYQVEYKLVIQIPQGAAQVAVGDVSGGNWDTEGTFIVESFAQAFFVGGDRGLFDPNACNGDGSPYLGSVIYADWVQRAKIADSRPGLPYQNNNSWVVDAYVPGSFERVKHSHFDVETWNGVLYGVVFSLCATVHFTHPPVLLATQTLDLQITISWARQLVN